MNGLDVILLITFIVLAIAQIAAILAHRAVKKQRGEQPADYQKLMEQGELWNRRREEWILEQMRKDHPELDQIEKEKSE